MSENSSTANNIFLLSDDPVEDSAFTWHKRIADALEGLIRTSPRGRIVGLFGTWGSGKSSIIKILEKAFGLPSAKRQDHEVFVFDAWVHANDPLRRSFYEELLEYYSRRRFIEKKDFEEDANKLSRKQEETETKTTPVIEPMGIALSLLFAASISYGGYFIKSALDEQVWTAYGQKAFILPLCFFLWPILLVPFSKKVGSYFFNKTSDKVKTRTIKTVDPTTIEFLEAFTKLTDTAQREHKHKLVIVVDNLDRLPDSEVLTLWATIRSFFTIEKEKRERIWVVVPLDPAMLQRALASGKSRGSLLAQVSADIAGARGLYEDGPDSRFTLNAFIEKTFEANFWVTPPVIADNHSYFTEQARQIFKDTMTQEEYDELFHIYETTRSYGAYGSDNTPRRIKGFLNQLGILSHLWEGKGISFRTLAVYTLVRDNISDLSSFLSSMSGDINHPIKQPQILAMKDPNWQKHFAALFYGVEPDKALQVVIKSKLVDALANGKTDAEAISLHKIQGFWHTLRRTIIENPYQWSTDYSALSSVVSYLKAVENDGTEVPRALWDTIIRGIGDIDPAKKLDNRSYEIIPFICSKAIDLGYVEKVGKLVSRIMCFHDTPKGQLKEGDKAKMVNTILAVCRTFTDMKTALPIHAIQKWASDIHGPVFWPVLRECVNDKEAVSYFKEIVTANTEIEDTIQDFGYAHDATVDIVFHGIEALTKGGYAGNFDKAIEYFSEVAGLPNLDEGVGIASFALGKMSNRLLFPHCDPSKRIQGLFSNGSIYRNLQAAQSQSRADVKAALMGLIIHNHLEVTPDKLKTDEDRQTYQNVRERVLTNPISNDEFGAKMTQVIQEQFTLESFTTLFSRTKRYNAFCISAFAVLTQVTNPVVSAEDIITHFTTYQTFFEVDTETEKTLLSLAEAQPDFWEKFADQKVVGWPFVKLTKRLVECNINQSSKAIDILYESLIALKVEDWKKAISEGTTSPVLDAVRFLTVKQRKQSYGAALGTSVIESIDVMAGYSGTDSAGFFRSLPEHLKTGEVDAFSKRVTSDLVKQARSGNWEAIEKRLNMYGKYHDDLSVFKGDEDDVISLVLMPAIEGNKMPVLSWMATQAKELKDVINKASAEIKGALEERLQSASLDAVYPEIVHQVTNIMSAWDIAPRTPTEEEGKATEKT